MRSIALLLVMSTTGALACERSEPQTQIETAAHAALPEQPVGEVQGSLPAAAHPFVDVFASNAGESAIDGSEDIASPLLNGAYCMGIIEYPTPQTNVACCPATCKTCTTTCFGQNDGTPGKLPNYCCAANVRRYSKQCGVAPCYYPKAW